MKKIAVCGLVFALFLLPIVMPLAKADNNVVHNAKTLRREHKQGVKRIRHRPKARKGRFLEGGLTAEERQAAKEQRQKQRKERRGLLQKQHEEKLKEQKNIQEQKRKLKEYHKHQRRNTVKKAGQELQPDLKEESAQQGQETMHQGTHEGQHH